MALAMHSEISRNGPHHIEIIAVSRRNAAELLVAKNHIQSALRNLWISHHGFRQTDMLDAAIESGLHWVDIGISNVTREAQSMDDAVHNAALVQLENLCQTGHSPRRSLSHDKLVKGTTTG